uniref:SET domain-containing protein n=2 Tax=Amorphochlora amoebiformis TaxID=1561963 RepID=A0A7S0CQD4_9EUKA
MTNEVAQKSKIGRSIIESGYDMRSEHSWLAAYLLQEKHDPNSFWKPYIDVLPGDYSNMPILFDDFYKKLLKGSYALQSAQNTMESLRAEYDGICNVCPEFRKYLFMEYIWGRLAVSTRVFGVTIDGKKTSALVPFADMSNHSANSQTDWQFDSKRDGFTMVANRPIKRGDQIYVNYGRKCNGRYFVNYGFTVDGNQNDNDAVFVADLPVEDQHYALKMKMVNRAYLNREFQVPATYSCDVSVLSENMKPHNMFTYFRILHAQDKELLVFSSKEFKENMKEMEPISTRNEIEVLKHLRRIAQERLSEFPDPIEVDHKLLKENKFMDSNHRNCVMMRCGEKETYRWYIALADKAIPLLQMTWNLKFKRLAANFWGVSSRFAHYITHVVVPLVKASKK